MGLEEQVVEYRDVLGLEPKSTLITRTRTKLASIFAREPAGDVTLAEPIEYGPSITINVPSPERGLVAAAGGHFPLFFSRAKNVLEKIPFEREDVRDITFQMDARSYRAFEQAIPVTRPGGEYGSMKLQNFATSQSKDEAVLNRAAEMLSDLDLEANRVEYGRNHRVTIRRIRRIVEEELETSPELESVVGRESLVTSIYQLQGPDYFVGLVLYTDHTHEDGIAEDLGRKGFQPGAQKFSRPEKGDYFFRRGKTAKIRYDPVKPLLGDKVVRLAEDHRLVTRIRMIDHGFDAAYDVCRALMDAGYRVGVPNLHEDLQNVSVFEMRDHEYTHIETINVGEL